jgi:feruloyl esterase
MGLGVSPSAAATPERACADLAIINASEFPVQPTQITMVKFNPAGSTTANGVPLPDHCQVQGIIKSRIGSDGNHYGDGFEVRLPIPDDWNGRFLFQGGGGTEGSIPPATGTAGTLSPALVHGWAVATQDGGHENSELPNPNAFYLEPQAAIDNAYGSIQATAQTAKFLIHKYYHEKSAHNYYYGCSTGGRQGMVFAQNFPSYFDGIIAGDPVYDLEALHATEVLDGVQIKAITPRPIQKINGQDILYPAFPVSDQNLFESALLNACDRLDGVEDGVIDNYSACEATFDPSTFRFPNGQPLQCRGAKTDACLSQAQIDAVKAIHEGPRLRGEPVEAPAGLVANAHADATLPGYPWDANYMRPSGLPSRLIGSPTTPPGDYGLGWIQFLFLALDPPNPKYDPLNFSVAKVDQLNPSTPEVTASTSLRIDAFRRHGGKMIWYHGGGDPGPSVAGTISYVTGMADRIGGWNRAQEFTRLYIVPDMGHCRGGPSTDQFDLLTPLVDWVENGVAPGPVVASGINFTTAPTTRSRPLCPYPQEVRYIGPAGGDLGVASNYACF